jgi:hypothetical protein
MLCLRGEPSKQREGERSACPPYTIEHLLSCLVLGRVRQWADSSSLLETLALYGGQITINVAISSPQEGSMATSKTTLPRKETDP